MPALLDSFPRLERMLLRDIGAPVEGIIVSAAVVTVIGAHTDRAARVLMAWAVVLVIYWLTHVYLHSLKDQLHRQAAPLHHRLADNAALQAGVLVGGVPVMASFLISHACGVAHSTAVWITLGWTIVQLGGTVFLASRAARLSTRRAIGESLMACLLGLALVVAKALLH